MSLLCAAPLAAQPQSVAAAPVLVIDSERLFLKSDFGIRVAREIEAGSSALASENRRIEAELATEEQELTERRATLSPGAFQPLADAFDTRVQETRQAQAAKSRALNAQLEQEREAFLNVAGPVLEELMREVGASVVLDRRTVFISAHSADITGAAIIRLNARLGQGAPLDLPVPADPPND